MPRDDYFGDFRLLAFGNEIKDMPQSVMACAAEFQMIATDALWQWSSRQVRTAGGKRWTPITTGIILIAWLWLDLADIRGARRYRVK